LERGHEVRVFDNLSTGRRGNLAHLEGRIEFLLGDLRDPAAVAEAMRGVEVVLHQGALPSVPRSVRDPVTTHEVNVTGTLNVLVAARDAGARRVVIASSSSVYGDTPVLPKCEEMTPAPKSPYAVSKLAGEHYARVFYQVYGLETVSLRYFNVFGPRQDPASQYAAVIPRFIRSLLNGGEITIYGDGEQTRDFTYVANVVSANLLAAQAPQAAGQVLNVACGEQSSLNSVVHEMARLLGREPKATFCPARPGEVRDSLADITRARELLGYLPLRDLRAGLAITVESLQQTLAP
jgi:nucleoside-diphosphate-sugar epimerase